MAVEKRLPSTRGSNLTKKVRKHNTTELSVQGMEGTITVPQNLPEYDSEMPSTFIREAAHRDAIEAESKYQQSRRTIATLLDTQAFLVTISDQAIQYRDAVYFLESNHEFKRCHSEDEPTRVRRTLGSIFEGNDKIMYTALRKFSMEMRRKRKNAKERESRSGIERYKMLTKAFNSYTDLTRNSEKYNKILKGLSWINENLETFELIIQLRQNRISDKKITERVNMTDSQVKRYVADARDAGLIKGTHSKIRYRACFYTIFYPGANISELHKD